MFRIAETNGGCWFRDDAAGRCAIHREFGEAALASACRQFPRICVLEPDAVSVSLSHFCPTAAGLLFDGEPTFSIVDSPPAFPSSWPFEGLDATNSYSPLLRPGVLLGFDGLRAFEEEAITTLGQADVGRALAQIEVAVEAIRGWTLSDPPLVELIRPSFAQSRSLASVRVEDPSQILRSIRTPEAPGDSALPLFPKRPPEFSAETDLALRKYLAARLIGAWITFQADDLQAVPQFLRLCLNSVFLFKGADGMAESGADVWKEAIRSADLWILHYADPDLLAGSLG